MIAYPYRTPKIFYFSILAFLSVSIAYCEQVEIVSKDSSQIALYKPALEPGSSLLNVQILESFRTDPDFTYPSPKVRSPGYLQIQFAKFFQWLVERLGKVLAWITIVIVSIILISAILLLGYGLFRGERETAFYQPVKDDLKFTVKREDINLIDFEKELEIALAKADYRKAVRLLFLATLKLMADASYIEWKPWKTNQDYLHELDRETIKEKFSQLKVFYEYIWYGNFDIAKTTFEEFRRIETQIKALII